MKDQKPNHGSPQFELGLVVATRGAVEKLKPHEVFKSLRRHAHGDWGDVCEDDRFANEEALKIEARLMSVYYSDTGIRFWIITEADRSVTTVLLPEEY